MSAESLNSVPLAQTLLARARTPTYIPSVTLFNEWTGRMMEIDRA